MYGCPTAIRTTFSVEKLIVPRMPLLSRTVLALSLAERAVLSLQLGSALSGPVVGVGAFATFLPLGPFASLLPIGALAALGQVVFGALVDLAALELLLSLSVCKKRSRPSAFVHCC